MIAVSQCFDRAKDLIDQYPVLWIMGLSIAIKLLLFSFDQVVNPDGVFYIQAARQMAEGNFAASLGLYPMPAYPLLLTITHFFIQDWIAAARFVSLAALVLASVPVYSITRILFNRQAAFWAALCFAVTPQVNDQATMVIRDPVFLLIILTAVLFFLKGINQQNLKLIIAALLLSGLSFLFRVEGIVLAITPVVFFLIKAFWAKDTSVRQFARKGLLIWLGAPLVFGIVIALVFGPQLLKENRIGELLFQVNQVVQFKAFENYQNIYSFFQSVEAHPPFSGFSKSLPAIVRHWMPLIYLIGTLEYFVKQIYPLFLFPLLLSGYRFFSKSERIFAQEKQFILLTWCVYILLVLYSFILRDFIQGRFLFTPAVLLYPWVGYGVTIFLHWLWGNQFARILHFTLFLVIVATPCIKSVRAVTNSDLGALEVGRFIAQDTSLANAKILFSDNRQWLYGKRTEPFSNVHSTALILSKFIEKGETKAIEKKAIKEKADAMVLSVNFKKTKIIPDFTTFDVYKRIPSKKGITIVYRRID